MIKFKDIVKDENLLKAIGYFGYEDLTEIQEQVIPEIIAGRDIIACSKTGSGKTAAFLIPILEHIIENKSDNLTAIIITPTREICLQVEEQIAGLSYFLPVSYVSIYGGNDQDAFVKQKQALNQGVNIVIATPGRFLSHMALDYINYDYLKFLVLDEADEMLDMGFYDDIMKIISYLPARQTLMFSATMPIKIKNMAQQILSNAVVIDINKSKPAEEIEQYAFLVYPDKKIDLLFYILENYSYKRAIVFASTIKSSKKIFEILKIKNIRVFFINSSLNQKERIQTVRNFKATENVVLVSTNLLSRGIDIDDVDLIINFEVPQKTEDYVHRIGRTARAGKTGIAISLVQPSEFISLNQIEKHIKKEIPRLQLPENLGDSPNFKIKNNTYRKRQFTNRKNNK